MPWTLNTAINTGDLDAGSYGEVKIVSMNHRSNRNMVIVELEYGNTVDDEWVPGIAPPVGKVTSYVIQGSEYTDLVTTHLSNDGELSYDAVKRGLYEHLAAQGVIAAGEVS